MNTDTFIAVLFALACIPLGIWMSKKRLAEKRKRFKDRPPISMNDLYRIHYSDSNLDKDAVIGLWKLIASTMKLDPEKLRPTDRLKEELGPVKGYPVPDELTDLEVLFRERCKELGTKPKIGMITTLDNFIKFIITGKQG